MSNSGVHRERRSTASERRAAGTGASFSGTVADGFGRGAAFVSLPSYADRFELLASGGRRARSGLRDRGRVRVAIEGGSA